GLGDFDTDANWPTFFVRLSPFLTMIGLLVTMLAVASMITLRRRKRSLLLPAPRPLGIAEECRRSGMAEGALLSARALKIAVVHINAGQSLHVTEVAKTLP